MQERQPDQPSLPRLTRPRTTALVQWSDGRVFEAPIGTPLEAYVRAAYPDPPVPIVAGLGIAYTGVGQRPA